MHLYPESARGPVVGATGERSLSSQARKKLSQPEKSQIKPERNQTKPRECVVTVALCPVTSLTCVVLGGHQTQPLPRHLLYSIAGREQTT